MSHLKIILQILFAIDIPYSAYLIGKIEKGEVITRSKRFFQWSLLFDALLIYLLYIDW